MKLIDLKQYSLVNIYGCSFTQGHEILDDIVLGKSFEEVNKLKHRNYINNQKILELEPNILQREAESSWAAQLCKNNFKKFNNFALRGNSLDRIFYMMYKLKTNNTFKDETVLNIIGLPPPERYMAITETGALTFIFLKDLIQEKGAKDILDYFNTETTYLNYFKNLLLINNTFKNVVFVSILFNLADLATKSSHVHISKKMFEHILNSIDSGENFLINEQFKVNPDQITAMGHYHLDCHNVLANTLQKYFI